ncbi:C-type lectin domain family 12 member B-like isoform X2 [Anabas testudineus]|uniref:C-type lectin domain-containing protein n=1 Tax=Anabas testudineus TaxID=64144 RepID=A0A7N6AQH6_ANATE|nr:C-type lectin domain family 12 member B-like isoform X2 [Anabas testudineus]
MSSDHGSSEKVRYDRKVEEDGAQWTEVEIYESAGGARDDRTGFQSQEGGPHTHRTSLRGAALCLGVLSLLMTAGIIVLSTLYNSVTAEKDQLQTGFNHINQSQTEMKQLQDQVTDLVLEKDQLQTRFNNLSHRYNQSQTEMKQLQEQITVSLEKELNKFNNLSKNYQLLQDKRSGKCPEGWTRFGCSCYFKSTEKKTWSESRTDCENRGSDLVMINSKEEQDFVSKLNNNEESWIGLWTKNGTTGLEWEWVDGSQLTETFWATTDLKTPTVPSYAVCCDHQGKWKQRGQNIKYYYKTWICEK